MCELKDRSDETYGDSDVRVEQGELVGYGLGESGDGVLAGGVDAGVKALVARDLVAHDTVTRTTCIYSLIYISVCVHVF